MKKGYDYPQFWLQIFLVLEIAILCFSLWMTTTLIWLIALSFSYEWGVIIRCYCDLCLFSFIIWANVMFIHAKCYWHVNWHVILSFCMRFCCVAFGWMLWTYDHNVIYSCIFMANDVILCSWHSFQSFTGLWFSL